MLLSSWSPLTEFFPPYSLFCPSERLSITWMSPHPAASSFYRIDISSHTEARQGSPLLHMCQGPLTSPCMNFGWWLSQWELPGVQVS